MLSKLKLSKRNYVFIIISFLIIIAVGITYAWWRWSSEINAQIFGKVCAPEIVFVGGTTINGTDLLPVRTKEEGLSKDINVNLNNTCANDTAVLNLNLVLENFSLGLADASFKWSLYLVTTEEVNNEPVETLTYVNDGNFANKVQADTISLATDLIVTENISTYRLFIWIDATMDNPSTIGDNVFRFKLYGTGRDAILPIMNPALGYTEGYILERMIAKPYLTSMEGFAITDFIDAGTVGTFYMFRPDTKKKVPGRADKIVGQLLLFGQIDGNQTDWFNNYLNGTTAQYTLSSNKRYIRFGFNPDDMADMYAYNTSTGKVYYAGINTPYYGMTNING